MKNRFKVVEMSIFAVVSLIFLNSVYDLFTDGKILTEGERKPLAAETKDVDSGSKQDNPSRALASQPSGVTSGMAGLVPYETKCQSAGETFETSASKVRILGPFCGAQAGRRTAGDGNSPDPAITEAHIENTTSHYVATVFSDHSTGKFSTDFVPLDQGPNKITMEFRYRNGKVFPVELTVIRK